MRIIMSEFNKIVPTQARPPKSMIFPDHPHPTMLVEGGQEPGDGPGWGVGKQNQKISKRGRYKANQREFYQVGKRSLALFFGELNWFGVDFFEQGLGNGLPDRILFDPNDGCGQHARIHLGRDGPMSHPGLP